MRNSKKGLRKFYHISVLLGVLFIATNVHSQTTQTDGVTATHKDSSIVNAKLIKKKNSTNENKINMWGDKKIEQGYTVYFWKKEGVYYAHAVKEKSSKPNRKKHSSNQK